MIGSSGQKAPIEIKMDFKELLDLAAQSFILYQLSYIADLDSAAWPWYPPPQHPFLLYVHMLMLLYMILWFLFYFVFLPAFPQSFFLPS